MKAGLRVYASRPGPASVSTGFTLVEMLVAMVILAMVMVAVVSIMRSMAQSQDRIEQKLGFNDERRVAAHFLKSALGQVLTRRSPLRTGQDTENQYQFEGGAAGLAWVGVLPARPGVGGSSFFRLALEAASDGEKLLVLRFAPWRPDLALPAWDNAQSYVVARGVATLHVAYEDTWQPVPVWVDAWRRGDSVPARVRIELTDASGPWPMLVIPLRQQPAFALGGSRFSIGGGGRGQ